MKMLNICLVSKNAIGAIALFLSVNALTFLSTQAQSYAGETHLQTEPASLPVLIYPSAKVPLTVRVNVDMSKRRGGPLTLVIRDEKGNTKYTELIFTPRYAGRFDLSPLGKGTYTFEFSNGTGQTFSRSFRIETSQPRVIALGDPNDSVFDLSDTIGLIHH